MTMLKKDQGDTKKFGYRNYSTIHQNKENTQLASAKRAVKYYAIQSIHHSIIIHKIWNLKTRL